MPNDFISREEAIELCSNAQGKAGSKAELAGISKIWHGLKRLPVADVAPVVHARWIVDEDGDVVCSNCGIDASCDCDGVLYTALFCGNCGARMDAKEDAHDDQA